MRPAETSRGPRGPSAGESTTCSPGSGSPDSAPRHLSELSGGQRQRVLLARALLTDPHLLVLDEPTSGIDVTTRHEVLHLLADLHRDGPAIVLATHDLNGLAAHLPRLLCLQRRVVATGSAAEVLVPEVLEATYGAPFEVLAHAGIPVVVDRGLGVLGHRHDRMSPGHPSSAPGSGVPSHQGDR